jgi:hypothetical protein
VDILLKDDVTVILLLGVSFMVRTEAESKDKHNVWDTMPELTITSPYVDSRVDSHTCIMGNPKPESTSTFARVDFIPQSGS